MEKSKLKNWKLWVCVAVLLCLGVYIQVCFVSTNQDFIYTSDTGQTFNIYRNIVDTGVFEFTPDSLVSTSLMTTLVPATIAKHCIVDPVVFFKYWLVLLVVPLPIAVFLIARHYYGYVTSLSAGVLIAGQFYFNQAGQLARINIALTFFAVGILVLLNMRGWGKYAVLPFVTLLIIISHYGTAFIVSGLLIGAWLLGQLTYRKALYRPDMVLWGLLLCLGVGVYYSLFECGPLHYAKNVVLHSVDITSPYDPTINWITGKIFWQWGRYARIWPLVLGGFLTFWATVLIIMYGLFLDRGKNNPVYYIGIGCIMVFAITLLLPYLSYAYGIMRVYFTALIILSLYFIKGGIDISRRFGVPEWFVPLTLAGANAFIVIGE